MQELMLKKRDKMGQVRGQLKVTYNSNFEKCMFSFILSIIFGFHELYLCACTIFIKDAAPLHDTMKNMLEPSPDDSEAEVITS